MFHLMQTRARRAGFRSAWMQSQHDEQEHAALQMNRHHVIPKGRPWQAKGSMLLVQGDIKHMAMK